MNDQLKHPRMKVAAIILAAGQSSRLRRPKQLVPFRGFTLIKNAVYAALFSQCEWVMVIIGAFHLRVRRELRYLDVDVVRSSLWHRGMGATLKSGVEFAMSSQPELDGFLFLLCDQPFLSEDHIDDMVKAFNDGHRLVASRFADTFGVPALIGKEYAEELLAMDDKQGAKHFLTKYTTSLKLIDFNGGEVDVDTPSDVEALRHIDLKQFSSAGSQ